MSKEEKAAGRGGPVAAEPSLLSLPTMAIAPLDGPEGTIPDAGPGEGAAPDSVIVPLERLAPELEQALDRPPGTASPADRYLRREELGKGGTGVVVAVEDRLLRRTIAVKRLLEGHATQLGRLFLHEARLVASLDHPSIIPVHDFGVDSSDRPYIAMKYVQGQTLTEDLRQKGALRDGERFAQLVEVFIRACEALAFAHDKGWLHADLKPANLMLGDYGETYVVDWGNAIPRHRWHRPLGYVAGTPGFMAPEQARGGAVDPRTDVYGLGACLFLCLTRRIPHREAGSGQDLVKHVASGLPPQLPAGAERAPAPLLRLALRCLSPDPDQRPADMLALKRELDRVRSGTASLPRQTVQPGETVVRQGEPGDTAYLVLQGELEVLQEGRGRIATLQTGDVFGELAPIMGGIRTSTVRATTACTLAHMSGDDLRASLGMGQLGGRFVRAIADRMLQLERGI